MQSLYDLTQVLNDEKEAEELLVKIGKENYFKYNYEQISFGKLKTNKLDKLKQRYSNLIFNKGLEYLALINIARDTKLPVDIREKAEIIIEKNKNNKLNPRLNKLICQIEAEDDFQNSSVKLIKYFSNLTKELRVRGIINSNNIKYDLAKAYVEKQYNVKKFINNRFHLDPLFNNRQNTYHEKQSLNAIFLNVDDNKTQQLENITTLENKHFSYLVIAKVTDNYELDYLLELTWDDFFKEKKYLEGNNYYIEIDDDIISKYYKS